MQNCNLARSLQFLRLDTHLTSAVVLNLSYAYHKGHVRPFQVVRSGG